jgi:hypothetical protein
MSQVTASPEVTRDERVQIDRICSAIRGKLQFMDYLVKTVVTDLERHQAESDAGTRIFLRQLIEMHAANLSIESENMRIVGDLCGTLDQTLQSVSDHDQFPPRKGLDGESYLQVT